MPIDWVRLGAVVGRFGAADDATVNKALDDADWLIAQGQSSWAEIGAQIAKLGSAARPPDDPRRQAAPAGWADDKLPSPKPNGVRRPASQYLLDKQDVELLMDNQEQISWAKFRDEMLPSFYEQCVEQQRTFSAKQRALVHEWLDKLGL